MIKKITADQPILSIIIVSFNTAALTKKCLESIAADVSHSVRLRNRVEVLVIDNKSSDDSTAVIQQTLASAMDVLHGQLIKHTSNAGFAQANNLGLAKATGEFLLLLNSDTVVQTGALDALINGLQSNVAKEQRVGLLAASLWNPDGTYQNQGGDQVSLLAVASQWLLLDDLPIIGPYLPSMQKKYHGNIPKPSFQTLGWVAATALCFSHDTYKQLGDLDKSIFMYAEDVEYCLRAQKAGLNVALTQQARITHVGSASGSSDHAVIGEVKGLLQIWPHYFSQRSAICLRLLIGLGSSLRIALFGISGNGGKAKLYARVLKLLWV